MRTTSALRCAAAGLALSGLALIALGTVAPTADGQTNFIHDGKAGFVVTQFGYALSRDASETGACPNGLSSGYPNIGDVLANRPDLQRRDDETDAVYQARSGRDMFGSTDNLCMRPESAPNDPSFRIVTGPNVPVDGGIDLDGQNATANGRAAPGTCAHQDFRGAHGERGVDNQFFRVVGCSTGFQQSNGQLHDLSTEMLTGSWGILIALSGVDDLRNDPEVQVSFYANADPIELSPTREPLANATYSPVADPRFRATTRGRIVNGVLNSDPVDVRFYSVWNTVRTERPLQDARVQASITADGGLEGYLAGYTPVEAMYDTQVGFRNGTEINGDPAPATLINTRSIGTAFTIARYTCQGAYQALHANADGHRDPATGRCTSISTQYHFRAASAFVAD